MNKIVELSLIAYFNLIASLSLRDNLIGWDHT